MENQDKVTDIKDVKWYVWYTIIAVLAFFYFLFTSEAEGMGMIGALGAAVFKAAVWPWMLIYSIF